MSNGGFGICGHKNSYNSQVLNGNFVEDRFGALIADRRGNANANAANYISTNQSSYIQPSKMETPNMGPEIDNSKLDYERKGVPGSILFGHGDVSTFGKSTSADYATMSNLTYGSKGANRSDDILKIKKGNQIGGESKTQTLARKKANLQAKEKREVKKLTYTSATDNTLFTMQIVSYRTTTRAQSTKLNNSNSVSIRSNTQGNNSSFTKSWQTGSHCNRDA
jgi:hypothetical protein